MLTDLVTFTALVIAEIICVSIIIIIKKKINKSQLKTAFLFMASIMLFICTGVILQNVLSKPLNIDPIYFEYIIYIGNVFLPVSILAVGVIYAKTKITIKKRHLLILIVPIISLLLLWTNDYHHLFYQKYSIYMSETVFGNFIQLYNIYSIILMVIGLMYLLIYSIKNSTFFSRQAILVLISILIPLGVNVLSSSKILDTTIYITPICFSITILILAIAIFKFKLLRTSPIALKKIVDRISDSFIVIGEDNNIVDFNKTFEETFKVAAQDVRGNNVFKVLNISPSIGKKLEESIAKAKKTNKTLSFEQKIDKIDKVFTIEVSTIYSGNMSLGVLILFKDITQHIMDMQTIKDNQAMLMEGERLASLGQLIGGIAHNLKTPIMSISGAAEGLSDLVKEYDISIENPSVNHEDHHEIARDMSSWITKIKEYTEYMSDIITAVKGQAVKLSENENVSFDLEELVKRVDILMKHELKNAILYLNVRMHVDSKLVISGDVNSLVQVINNMISNSIQAYNGRTGESIILDFSQDGNNLIISIQDNASGLPKNIKDKIFKEMITTKGKNGTGLGLYMSYSTIKANFNGNITFESEEGKGTTFNISLPIND